MAKDNDRDHFKDYRAQTRVKHSILEAYLGPYFQIVGATNDTLVYVDGFAGPGTYTKADSGEAFDGSPLRALKLIADNRIFAKKVDTVFIEVDPELHCPLEEAVSRFAADNDCIRKPTTLCCTFADGVRWLLDHVKGNLAPTFLFVDPCGVEGTVFETIKSVMAYKSSEAFIFFNIDGIRRIAGLSKPSEVLVELLGSRKRAEEMYAAFQRSTNVNEREQMILQSYRQALRDDMGVPFTIPFRIESEDGQKTSHYLIHATKHALGFKIMKDVMWRYGHSDDQQGGLQFEQASRTNYLPLVDFTNDEIKQKLLIAIGRGQVKVAVFCDGWVCRPDDMLCETAYKRALLELEAVGDVEVISKDGKNVVTAAERPKRNGKSTLANDYYVRVSR
jgi:three-Cys-motif partner protein